MAGGTDQTGVCECARKVLSFCRAGVILKTERVSVKSACGTLSRGGVLKPAAQDSESVSLSVVSLVSCVGSGNKAIVI